MWRVIVPLVVVMCASCHQVPRLTEGLERTPELKQVIECHLPLGASLAEARHFMETEDFSCELKMKTKVRICDDEAEEPDEKKGRLHQDVDCLYCYRKRYVDWFVFVTTRVTLVFRDDRLIDLQARMWPTGL